MHGDKTKICFIHTGTHKTASTYIQSRLLRNAKSLKKMGITYSFCGLPEKKHKPIAMGVKNGNLSALESHLTRNQDQHGNLLLSAEQFAVAFSVPENFYLAKRLAEEKGYSLHLITFIRPQTGYINSKYIQETKRFYHSVDFEEYVASCINSSKSDIFDYFTCFNHFQEAGNQCTFLPFGKKHGDPFLRLMGTIRANPTMNYLPAASSSENAQPGKKGVYLARRVTDRMKGIGINGKHLSNTTKIIPKISAKHGWSHERFYGFSKSLEEEVKNYYLNSNKKFSRQFWGCEWRDVFEDEPEEVNTFSPTNEGEERLFQEISSQVLRYLARKNRDRYKELIQEANLILHP